MLMIIGFTGLALTSCKNKSVSDPGNPFFSEWDTPFNVPPFEKIMAKHYMPAFEQGMKEGRNDIKNLLKNREEPDFANTIEALDKLSLIHI